MRAVRTARLNPDDDNAQRRVIEARRELYAEKIAGFVRETVEKAPPLLPEQRDRIVTLLRAGTS
jgi:hypothetical protein